LAGMMRPNSSLCRSAANPSASNDPQRSKFAGRRCQGRSASCFHG
jgi:hypothetical protein